MYVCVCVLKKQSIRQLKFKKKIVMKNAHTNILTTTEIEKKIVMKNAHTNIYDN